MSWLDLDSYVKTSLDIPAPEVSACGGKSSEDNKAVAATPGSTPVTLSRTEIDGVLAVINNLTDSNFNECSIRLMAFNFGKDVSNSQSNSYIWYAVASYLLRTKFLGDYLKAGQGSASPVANYLIVSNGTSVDAQIRKELSGISETQLESAVRSLATELLNTNNPAAGEAFFEKFTPAQQARYKEVCSSGEPSGLRFWGMLYNSPAYPEPMSLVPMTKEEMLKIIIKAKADNPSSATAGGADCKTVDSAKQCLNTLDKSLRVQVFSAFYTPTLDVCSADKTDLPRGQTTTVNLAGVGLGLFAWDAQSQMTLMSNFKIDLGNGVTATAQMPQFNNDYGIFYALPVSIQVEQNAACGSRTLTARNGQTVLDTLENFRVTGCGGGKPQCSDGIDNDGDGKIDYPQDPDCRSPQGRDERGCDYIVDDNIRASKGCPPLGSAPQPQPQPQPQPEPTAPAAGGPCDRIDDDNVRAAMGCPPKNK